MSECGGVVSGTVVDKIIAKALREESCRVFLDKLLIMNYYELSDIYNLKSY